MKNLPTPPHRWLFRIYYGGVIALALLALVLAAPRAGAPQPIALVIALLLMILAEAGPVPLPSGGYATASAIVDLPCIVIFGPFYTAVLDMVSTFIIQALVLRKPPIKVVYNMAIFALTDFAAGLAFLATGGEI